MPTSRPPACLFDMDGTLLDSHFLILDAWRFAHRTVCPHLPLDEEKLVSLFGRPSLEVIKGVGIPKNLQKPYLNQFRSYMMQHRDSVTLKKDVKTVLKYFYERRIRMAVVTGARTSSARWFLERLGIINYFDAIIGADATEKGKPHPDPIIKALNHLNITKVDPSIPFVGDSMNDVKAAHSAGITPVYLCHDVQHETHDEVLRHDGVIIHSLIELIDFIEKPPKITYSSLNREDQ